MVVVGEYGGPHGLLVGRDVDFEMTVSAGSDSADTPEFVKRRVTNVAMRTFRSGDVSCTRMRSHS